MAEQKQLPAFVGAIHRRFFTPYVAIVITALVMLFLTLKSSFLEALTISAIARLITYGSTCLALLVFRARGGVPAALFRLPSGKVIATLSILLIVWLLLHITLAEARSATAAGAVGLVIYFAYWLFSRS